MANNVPWFFGCLTKTYYGKRVIGYDNSERKGDHRHYGDAEEPYGFTTLRQLTDDFLNDVEQIKRNLA
jgi:hypothetical protein